MKGEVERLVTHFPIVIREANKRQDTPPHCMFAIEELVGKALHSLKLILLPGEPEGQSWIVVCVCCLRQRCAQAYTHTV